MKMSKRILICDDAAFIRMQLKEIMQKCGCEVVAEAENGKEAIALFKEHSPDFVLLDITMPFMDGVEALKEIMELDKTAKVIMLSALGQNQIVMACIKLGARDFIVKPFSADRLMKQIEKIMS